MGEIGSGTGTSYPSGLDTDITQEVNSPNAGKTKARAEVVNDLGAAVVAIETELGTDPAGTATDLKTRLAVAINDDGTIKSGTVLTAPQINDTSSDHQYVVAVSELTADRTVTLPLLAANDEFVFKTHAVTMANKTLTSPVMQGSAGFGITPTAGLACFSASVANNPTIRFENQASSTADGAISCYEDANGTYVNIGSNHYINTSGTTVLFNTAEQHSGIQLRSNGDTLFYNGTGTSANESAKITSDGSFVVGSPTGGGKGSGTINAQAVYDDNVLLTCYVFDAFLDGIIDNKKWDAKTPGDRIHAEMRRFKSRLGTDTDPLDIDKYTAYWKSKRHLTSLPNEANFAHGDMATGEWIQRLVETVEIQAVHIDALNTRLKNIEAVWAASGAVTN